MHTSTIIQSVEQWIVPPSCQGQHIEYAYAVSDDGIPVRRITDRSGPEVRYERADDYARDDWAPQSEEPSGYDWRPIGAS